MNGQRPDISGLRQDLNEVDAGIVRLIAERHDIIDAIAAVKEQGAAGIQDADRERQVLDGVAAAAADLGVSGSLVRRIFRELINDSVAQQARLLNGDARRPRAGLLPGRRPRLQRLGGAEVPGRRGLDGDLTGFRSFREAAGALLAGDADLAVLPIENTTAGSINEVYALLREHELYIVGEETLKVEHCLAALGPVPLSALTKILSHPQGLEQCTRSSSRSRTRSRPPTSTRPRRCGPSPSRAIPRVGGHRLGGRGPAYGLEVLRHNISDQADNFTRFVVLSRTPAAVDVRIPCKTSLILVTRHEEGALLRCLEVLAASGHSMTKLESRPRPGRPWEYLFFIDIEGNVDDPRTAAALDELRTAALFVKVLGSYPAKALRAAAGPAAWPASPRRTRPPAREAGGARPRCWRRWPARRGPPLRRSRQYKLVDRAARQADTVSPSATC